MSDIYEIARWEGGQGGINVSGRSERKLESKLWWLDQWSLDQWSLDQPSLDQWSLDQWSLNQWSL